MKSSQSGYAVKAEMLARGLVLEFKEPVIEASLGDYEPIEVARKPIKVADW